MAIKISGTTVVDDSRNLVNINSGTIAGIQSGGSIVGAGATTINFIGLGNTFNYNPSTKTLDISISGAAGGVGIQSGGTLIGAGITQLNFIGSGNTFSVSGNTVDISISSGNTIIDKESFNVGAAGTNLVTLTNPYSAGFVDVYLNGLKLSPGDFSQTSANVIGLTTAAVQGDTIDVVSFRALGSIGDVGLKVQQDSVGIGTSISTLNFVGGASTFFNRGNNILDVYIAQGRINKQTFNVGASGTTLLTLSQPYESGKIDIYRNGVRLASSDFTELTSTTVGLATSAVSGDVVEIQSFAGVVNTNTFSVLDNLKVNGVTTTTNLNATSSTVGSNLIFTTGISTNLNVSGVATATQLVATDANITGVATATQLVATNANITGVATFAQSNPTNLNVSGIATVSTEFDVGAGATVFTAISSTGLVGVGTNNPTQKLHVQGNVNITGYSTATETRFYSVAEKITRVNGNTVSINYSSGSSNLGLCTNASGDVTLAVTGIPTDSSFDNHVISFGVIIQQAGTARTCTAVSLNGLSRSILWSGGSLSQAVSGLTSTGGIVIYNFTGINTVGSANTTGNYQVIGVANGSFY